MEEYEYVIHNKNDKNSHVDPKIFEVNTEKVNTQLLVIPKDATIKQVEQAYLLQVYTLTGENVAEVAKITGLSLKTVYNKMYEYGFKTKKEILK